MIMSIAQLGTSTKRESSGLTIDSAHHKSYLRGVGGAGEVGIDLFGLGLVEGDKSVEDVITSRSIIRAT